MQLGVKERTTGSAGNLLQHVLRDLIDSQPDCSFSCNHTSFPFLFLGEVCPLPLPISPPVLQYGLQHAVRALQCKYRAALCLLGVTVATFSATTENPRGFKKPSVSPGGFLFPAAAYL
jgi:hypothetical protein